MGEQYRSVVEAASIVLRAPDPLGDAMLPDAQYYPSSAPGGVQPRVAGRGRWPFGSGGALQLNLLRDWRTVSHNTLVEWVGLICRFPVDG